MIFGLLFKSASSDYVVYLAASLILWNYLVQSVSEAANSYIQSEKLLKQIFLPVYFPLVRNFFKSMLLFGHNVVLYVLISLFVGQLSKFNLIGILLGLLILMGFLFPAGAIMAIFSTRYRDIPQILTAGFTLLFYVTPVIWNIDQIPDPYRDAIATLNPLFSLMEVIRAPLMGEWPTVQNITVSLVLVITAWIVAGFLMKKSGRRIVYWL